MYEIEVIDDEGYLSYMYSPIFDDFVIHTLDLLGLMIIKVNEAKYDKLLYPDIMN